MPAEAGGKSEEEEERGGFSNWIHLVWNKTSPSPEPPPARDCVVLVKKSRHSGEGRNPVAVLLNNSIFLDARLRGHDELRHGLQGERGFRMETRKPSIQRGRWRSPA